MSLASDSQTKLNFEAATILLLEQSVHSVEILAQMFYGFGARDCYKITDPAEAKSIAVKKPLDLLVLDPNLAAADGYAFVQELRRGGDPNRTIPAIVISANGTRAEVERARDAGASYFIAKPVTPIVLLDRIVRITRDSRTFVVSDAYVGPDRRFRSLGPPPGVAPRRSTDIKTKLGEATTPNLSQSEIDSLFKPQKVVL